MLVNPEQSVPELPVLMLDMFCDRPVKPTCREKYGLTDCSYVCQLYQANSIFLINHELDISKLCVATNIFYASFPNQSHRHGIRLTS